MSLEDHLEFVIRDTLEEFVARYAPGFRLPATFGGHLVGTDAVADLAFTLGWMSECGIDEVAGVAVDDAVALVLAQVDGPGTHSFYSYRVAETLARYGPFDDNALLSEMTADQRDDLRTACDSTELIPLLDGLLPLNYAAVLARCEVARERLGILDDPAVLDDLVDRSRALIAANPHGFLDESHEGAGRFDIYAADIFLFCEPLADRLGDDWRRGAAKALDLVLAVAARDGSAVPWGRSTGLLSIALTFELAALGLARGLTDEPLRWMALADRAARDLVLWFEHGVTTAHQHRSTEEYRGTHRRLQMTFDVLGKLAYASATLRRTDGSDLIADLADLDEEAYRDLVLPRRDRLYRLSDRAAVWTFRNEHLGFALPLVSGRSSDYLPAPRQPGLFETPVDSTLACFVPVAHAPGGPLAPQRRFAPGEVPVQLHHDDDGLRVEHAWVATRAVDDPPREPDGLDGSRTATYRVRGATLEVHERLTFAEPPAAITVSVPENRSDRPLRVTATSDRPLAVRTVDVAGIKEWYGTWDSPTAVTEIEVEPATEVSFRWSVAPKSRVAVTLDEHHYVRTVYDPVADELGGRLAERSWETDHVTADVAHVHWPEWCFGYGIALEEHRAIANRLRRQGTRIAWTQHNLTPHLDEPEVYDPIYQCWADACDLAVHHSEWGRLQVTKRYSFRDGCVHVVIPHPHFGPLVTANARVDRDEAAERLGLPRRSEPPALRIGMIGAPRKEKDVRLVVDALADSGRDDIELVIWSLSFTDPVPDDPRIVASVYDNVDRATYDLRLAACDAIALPFTGHTMLATGTASDLVATGTPGLVTDWPYLTEHLGGLGVAMGATRRSWAHGLAALDRSTLDAAAGHAAALRDRYDPTRIGNLTADAIEALGVRNA